MEVGWRAGQRTDGVQDRGRMEGRTEGGWKAGQRTDVNNITIVIYLVNIFFSRRQRTVCSKETKMPSLWLVLINKLLSGQ